MPIHRTTTGLQLAHSDFVQERPKLKLAFGSPRAYVRRKPTSFRLDPLEATYKRLQAGITNADSQGGKPETGRQRSLSRSSDSVMLATTTCRPFHLPNDTTSQLELIQEYNNSVQKRSKVPLPPVRINVRNSNVANSTKDKVVLRKPRTSCQVQNQGLNTGSQQKGQNKTSVKLSDKSTQGVSVKSKNLVASNNPPEIKFQRERSTVILKAHSVPPPTERSSKPKASNSEDLPNWEPGLNITKNHTIILPKLSLEQEADLQDNTIKEHSVKSEKKYIDLAQLGMEANTYLNSFDHMPLDAFTPSNSPVQDDDTFDQMQPLRNPKGNVIMPPLSSSNGSYGVVTMSSSAPVTVKYPKRLSKVTIGDGVTFTLPAQGRERLVSQQSVSEWNKTKAESLRRGSLRSPSVLGDQEPGLDRADMAKLQRALAENKETDKKEVPPSKTRTSRLHRFSIGHPLHDSIQKDNLDHTNLEHLYERGIYHRQFDATKDKAAREAEIRRYLEGGYAKDMPPQPPPSMANTCIADGPEFDFKLVINERRKARDTLQMKSRQRLPSSKYPRTLPYINDNIMQESTQSLVSSENFTTSYQYESSATSSGESEAPLPDYSHKSMLRSTSQKTSSILNNSEDHRLRLANITLMEPENAGHKGKEDNDDAHDTTDICLILEPNSPSPDHEGQNQAHHELDMSRSISSISSTLTHPETDDIGSLPGSPYGNKMALTRRSSSIDSFISRPGSELLEVPLHSLNVKDRVPGQESPHESPTASPTWSQHSEENHGGDLQQQVVHRVSGPMDHIPVTPAQSPDPEAMPRIVQNRCSLPEDGSLPPAVSLTTDDGDDFAVWFGRRGSIFIEEKQEEEDKNKRSLQPTTTTNEKGQVSLAVPTGMNN